MKEGMNKFERVFFYQYETQCRIVKPRHRYANKPKLWVSDLYIV